METELVLSYSSIGLMAALGLRHGLDPDHIAAIDGITLRAIEQRPAVAPWVGTFFSLGHGLVVTLIAVAVSLVSRDLYLPPGLANTAAWIPIALLILVGILNLRSLLARTEYHAVGWRSFLLPSTLRQTSHPLAILLVGMIFALVFDTATQAAAWGYVAGAQGGVLLALSLGLAFTIGMVTTDTLDCRIVASLLKHAQRQEAQRYRRVIGWTIVLLSFGMAGYGIAARLEPGFRLSDDAYLALGALLFIVFASGYAWTYRKAVSAR